MLRFRIWDNESREYLENLDSFSMDCDGYIRWYDGSYLNGSFVPGTSVEVPNELGRYEVEYGNAYCFHNDIVQGKRFGGHFDIENFDLSDSIPRNAINIVSFKNSDFSIHEIYWDVTIRGIALMEANTLEFFICGLTCRDRFYDYDGCRFSWSDISVVGNARTDEYKMCKSAIRQYESGVEHSILPIISKTEENKKES